MGRTVMLMAAAVLGAMAVGFLALAFSVERTGLSPDMAWAEPYVGPGGMIAGGLALASAFLLVGLSMGRWRHPRPVPDAQERRHEGVQG